MKTEACQLLKTRGIAPTPQRVAIFKAVLGRRDHPSADDVFRALRESMPTLSKTTVYAAMQLLAKKRLIGCVHLDGEVVKYDGCVAFHAHFRCRECGKTYDVKLAGEHARPFASLPKGFEFDNEELTYYGICPSCKAKKNKKKGK